MDALIALLPGDGIGPEVTAEAEKILRAVASRFDHDFGFEQASIGGAAVDAAGDPLPAETLELCRRAGAVFLGAVGGDKWNNVPAECRPERGLLRLRGELGLFANLRPVKAFPALAAASPLRPELAKNIDFVIVRELTGGAYFGERHESESRASDLCEYSVAEIERIVRLAGQIAMRRRRHITSVDKANVLATSRLWRKTADRVIKEEFPDVELQNALIDSTAMLMITRPRAFDVIVTENMFGDILSDEGAGLVGTLGLLPSASLGDGKPGVFEPVHGSAPSIAGLGIANPYAAILTAAMLLEDGLGLTEEAAVVRGAVDQTIAAGYFTEDLAKAMDRDAFGTSLVGDAVAQAISGELPT